MTGVNTPRSKKASLYKQRKENNLDKIKDSEAKLWRHQDNNPHTFRAPELKVNCMEDVLE